MEQGSSQGDARHTGESDQEPGQSARFAGRKSRLLEPQRRSPRVLQESTRARPRERSRPKGIRITTNVGLGRNEKIVDRAVTPTDAIRNRSTARAPGYRRTLELM